MNNVITVAPFGTQTDDELIVLVDTLAVKGGIVTQVDDDSVVIDCTTQQSFYDICDLLDSSFLIDEYDITLWHKNANGLVTKVDTDIVDISGLDNFNNIRITIIAFIDPMYVDYNTYTDINESITLNSNEPLLLSFDDVDSKVNNGKFCCVVNGNSLEVYADYSNLEINSDNINNITNDVNTINNGLINKKLLSLGYTLTEPSNTDISNDITNYDDSYTTAPAIYTNNNIDLNEVMKIFNTTLYGEVGVINEAKRVLKVNFKGVKRIKIKCQRGYKYDETRKACVKIAGNELATMRRAKIKMVRTKRSKGASFQRAVNRKTSKAMRFRKLMGK